MELQNNFQERAEDIESFFSLLTFIDSIESYGINSNIYTNNSHIKVTAQLQQCLRSHAILLLYNLLESTINNCIWRIYDKIHDEKLTYNDLSTSLKKIWLSKEYKEDTKLSKTIDKTYKIIEEHNEKKILFTQIADSISGNIDLRKIESLFKQYQCNIDFAYSKEKIGKYLLQIKNDRNLLAHGNISFSHKGSILLTREIIDMKNEIISFLQSLIHRVENYIINEEYKHNDGT